MLRDTKNKEWLEDKVIKGRGFAKTLEYPTVNLAKPELLKNNKKGVYLAKVQIGKISYYGLLYYGPRKIFKEVEDIAEIFVLDFNKEIYGRKIKYQLLNFIRCVMDFDSPYDLAGQLKRDLRQAKRMIK